MLFVYNDTLLHVSSWERTRARNEVESEENVQEMFGVCGSHLCARARRDHDGETADDSEHCGANDGHVGKTSQRERKQPQGNSTTGL